MGIKTVKQIIFLNYSGNYIVLAEGIKSYYMGKSSRIGKWFDVEQLLCNKEYYWTVINEGYAEVGVHNSERLKYDYHPFSAEDIVAYKKNQLRLKEKYDFHTPEKVICLYKKLKPSDINSFYQLYIYIYKRNSCRTIHTYCKRLGLYYASVKSDRRMQSPFWKK